MKIIILTIIAFILLVVLGSCNKETGGYITTSDGIEMFYESKDSGQTTILFVPGWSNNHMVVSQLTDHFARNYHTIAIDPIGYGMSRRNREEWTIEQYGKDIRKLVKKLNPIIQIIMVS
jgi:pimeloyl-ACP methyl ester carboxylesterase